MTDLDPAAIMAEHKTHKTGCLPATRSDDTPCLVYQIAKGLAEAHQELRQGWPKMARDANRSAIEQWNRADALAAALAEAQAKIAELEQGAP